MTKKEIDELRERLRKRYLEEIDKKIEVDIKKILEHEKLREERIKEYRGKLVSLDSHGDYFIFEDIEYSDYSVTVKGKIGLYYNGGSFGKSYRDCLTLTDNYIRHTTNGSMTLRECDRDWFDDVVESKRVHKKVTKR